MSKVLLAAGLDLLREAERSEIEADRLYQEIIKSGDKNKNFHPVRENLRAAYQKWIQALESVNFVRRAAVEAERLKKLRKQLAKFSEDSENNNNGEGEQQEQRDENGALLTDIAASKQQLNAKRGLAAVSDEMIRNGVPHEIITLCDQRMRTGFEHCEKIREKEASLLLSLRDADTHKDDCSKSRPTYQVAQVLAFRNASPKAENEGLLQGNYTVTVPAVDGSYQILIKNMTDVLVAAPDVTCQVLASWKPVNGSNQVEKREFRGPCPPGAAFLRSVGVVGNEGSIFVHVNSNGMRSSRIEVTVRRLVPQSAAMLREGSSNSATLMTSPTVNDNKNNYNNNQQMQQQQQGGGGELQNLLPPIVPLGGAGIPQQPQLQQQQNDNMMMMQQNYQNNMVTDANSHFQIPNHNNNQQYQEPPPFQQQQQQQHAALPTAAHVKKRIAKLFESIEYEFPKEVVAPVSLEDDPSDKETQKRLLEQESNKRTEEERAFEAFLMELPEPTDLFGNDDNEKERDENYKKKEAEANAMLRDLEKNMGPTMEELREMEEQMLGLEEDDE